MAFTFCQNTLASLPLLIFSKYRILHFFLKLTTYSLCFCFFFFCFLYFFHISAIEHWSYLLFNIFLTFIAFLNSLSIYGTWLCFTIRRLHLLYNNLCAKKKKKKGSWNWHFACYFVPTTVNTLPEPCIVPVTCQLWYNRPDKDDNSFKMAGTKLCMKSPPVKYRHLGMQVYVHFWLYLCIRKWSIAKNLPRQFPAKNVPSLRAIL